MKGDWIAAATRARGLARRRLGAGAAQQLAADDLPTALDVVAASLDPSERTVPLVDRSGAEHAIRASLLWRIRVLAGWAPRQGAGMFRALAAPYERDNAVALAQSFADGVPAPAGWELGSLATAWPRLKRAQDFASLRQGLGSSPWGRVDAARPGGLRDELTAAWLRRLAVEAPLARPWAVAGSALLAARVAVVEGETPQPRLGELLRPFLGETWPTKRTLDAFAAALPHDAAEPLRELKGTEELWRAEARLVARIEAESLRVLRRDSDGPAVVVAAVALLAVDAWRTRAALAVAARRAARATGPAGVLAGDREGSAVLDVVA